MPDLRPNLKHPSIKAVLLIGSSSDESFYTLIRMPNATYRTTARGRLKALDEWTMSFFPARQALSCLDIGVSSACTTVDLMELCTAQGRSLKAVAVDLFMFVNLLSLPGLRLLASAQNVLQLDLGPLSFPNIWLENSRKGGFTYLLLSMAKTLCRCSWLPWRQIAFVEPRAVRLAKDGLLDLRRGDVLTGEIEGLGEQRFDLVRAVNILNRAYFSDAQITEGIVHLGRRVAENGFLLVGRSENARTIATLYRKDEGRFRLVARHDGGSDIEDLLNSALDIVE